MLYSVYDYNHSKEYLLFIHGLGANSKEFFRNVRELGKYYKCVVFDLNGYGRSIDIDKPLTIEQVVDDVREFMIFRSVEKANILGHSMGGMVAIEFVVRYPAMVDKLIIVDSCADIWENASDYIKLRFIAERIKFFVAHPGVFRDGELWDFVYNLFKENAPEHRWYINTFKYALSIMRWCRIGELEKIDCDTLVVKGKHDHLIYENAVKTLLEGIKNSSYCELEQSEHSPNVVRHKEFNDCVLRFLRNG